jgi:Fe-Mn family superoxide dismutase
MQRREMIGAMGAGAAAAAFGGINSAFAQPNLHEVHTKLPASMTGWSQQQQKYILPPLPYDYDALEPHIDEMTMKLHHDRHHAGYVDGLNNALAMLAEIRTGKRPASEIQHWERELAFNGSGHVLHMLFWNCMSPDGGGKPSGRLAEMIDRDFGSFEQFKSHFQKAAATVEGSGWGLLVFEPLSGRLRVLQAEKHQNLTMQGVQPLLVVDVWEHAYYLKYQNHRGKYLDAFLNVVNWPFIAAHVPGGEHRIAPERGRDEQ